MNKQAKLNFTVAAFLLVTLLSVGTAGAQSNTWYGTGALGNPSSPNLGDSAFGYNALHYPDSLESTSGNQNTACGAYALEEDTTGRNNTATGYAALAGDFTGNENTASGSGALNFNSGNDNTGNGFDALWQNSTGSFNTASGAYALQWTTGSYNTASGYQALQSNQAAHTLGTTTGTDNTATGYQALQSNTTGNGNTASGYQALQKNTMGIDNTASGYQALYSNIGSARSCGPACGGKVLFSGYNNTASGYLALHSNTYGSFNTASGESALYNNTTGNWNTAVGVAALLNTTGYNNVALGYGAGQALTTGSNNIDIGSVGVAAESNTIRIGTKGTQTATYIAGISGVGVISGAPVEVTSAGQLGIVMSSARYKHDIRDIGANSSGLLKLRPVSFHYNNDPTNTLQYGLVAEDVAKVYPELVVYGPDGKVMTVRYSMLSAMLLNELQKQNSELRNQTATNQRQAEQIRKMTKVEASFEQRLSRLEQPTQAKNGNRNLVAAFNK